MEGVKSVRTREHKMSAGITVAGVHGCASRTQ